MTGFEIFTGACGLSALTGMMFLLGKHSRQAPLREFYWPSLVFKLLAGWALGWIYFFYYRGGDTVAYHRDALTASELALRDFPMFLKFFFSVAPDEIMDQFAYASQPRALMMAKATSIIYLISFRNYWLASLFFSFFSFAGMWFLSNRLVQRFSVHKAASALAFLFVPSVVFWSSGLLKESVMMGAIGFLVSWFTDRNFSVVKVVLCIGSILVVWFLKYYYAAVLAAILVALAATYALMPKQLLHRKKYAGAAIFGSFFGLVILLTTLLHPNLNFDRILIVLVENYRTFEIVSPPENFVNLGNLEPEWLVLAKISPLAVFSGLFRPFPWETPLFPGILAGIENLVIAALSMVAIVRMRRFFPKRNYLYIAAALVFISVMSFFLTVSTPNFGSLARYKVGFMPFYLVIIFDILFRSLPAHCRRRQVQD